MKRYSILLLLSFIFLIVTGCQESGKDDENQVKIPVSIEEIERGEVKQSLSFNGDIHAKQEVKVFSKIPDRIEKFYVDEGDFVKKDDIIAKVMATTIEQAVLQAERSRGDPQIRIPALNQGLFQRSGLALQIELYGR